MTDSDPDVRWMTYAEAAAALGVNPESVAVSRGGWSRRSGNDGKPRVAVPVSVLPPVPVNVPDGASRVQDYVPDTAQSVPDKSLADVVAVFREERDQLRGERDAAQAALIEARERAGRAEGEAIGLREAVRLAEDSDREALEREAAAMARVEQVQAENAGLRADFQNALGRAQRAEGEAAALRGAAATTAGAARRAAEAARDSTAAAAEAARGKVAALTAGSRLRRAWVALRGRP